MPYGPDIKGVQVKTFLAKCDMVFFLPLNTDIFTLSTPQPLPIRLKIRCGTTCIEKGERIILHWSHPFFNLLELQPIM